MRKEDYGWVYNEGTFPSKVGKIVSKEYRLWGAMFVRCNCDKYKEKYPTYVDCSASSNFKNFQFFAEWCNNQIGFGNKHWELDKDLLIRGNKVYSECAFGDVKPEHVIEKLEMILRGELV